MKTEDLAQAWTVAYGIAFASLMISSDFRGGRLTPEDIDSRARALADKAIETVRAKLAEADTPRKGK